MIFDTHAHYEDEAFDVDRADVIRSLPDEGIGHFVNVASTWDSLEKTKAVAEHCAFASAAYGIHPDNVGELDASRMETLRAYCETEKCVAVGEIGLDYHWSKENRDAQIFWFRRQIELAGDLGLPVIIHSRDAAADTMAVAKEADLKSVGGVMHCYSYSEEQAEEYIRMGLYLGIGGVVTFKNARRLKEVVQKVPLERLVLETDCPYLAPEPNRGKRNWSGNLRYVVRAIADLKGVPAEKVERVTWENALKLYRL